MDNTEIMKTHGGILDSIDQFYGFIAALKTVERHLVSNIYMTEEEISSLIEEKNFHYYYVPGKYVNFWKLEWNFVRLYYYIADINSYDVPIITGKVICDFFFQRETERSIAIKCMLEKVGFREYALFRKYVKKANLADEIVPSGKIITGTVEGFYELLRECFDVYTDLVPEPDKAEQYLSKEICYSSVDDAGKITGGTVISKKGSVETEEFTFVKPEMRGRGLARKLREYSYANAGEEVTQFVSWVRNDNELSWRQLLNLGYKESNAYKITMMKG